MSTEFILNATFTVQSQKHYDDLNTLIEHLELNENSEALTILKTYNYEKAMSIFDSTLTPYSNYQAGDELITMYQQTYNDNVEDMVISLKNQSHKVTIEVEGWDREAVDYCSALTLLLIASGVSNLDVKAGTDYWHASWSQNCQGDIELQLKEYDS